MVPPSASAKTASQIKILLKELNDDRADAVRLDELRRLFAKLVQSGDLDLRARNQQEQLHRKDSGSSSRSVKEKWRAFLRESHKCMVDQLCHKIKEGKRTAVRTFWGVIATSPVASNNGKYHLVSTDLLLHWVRAVSKMPHEYMDDKSVKHMVQAEFLQPFRDIQYYIMIAIRVCANELYHEQRKNDDEKEHNQESSKIQARAERLMQLLSMIPIPSSQEELESSGDYLFPPPEDAVPDNDQESGSNDSESEEDESDEGDGNDSDESDESDVEETDSQPPKKRQKVAGDEASSSNRKFAFQQVRSHHRGWSKAWLAVLRLELPDQALKQALQFIPQQVLPNVANPLQFSDFFMSAYDNTGVISVLALDGLFLLMTQHGLEYPDFYKQLYRLVTPSLLYVKYRTRFFRLLDKCLCRNEMLPAHVVAAFVKRLLRSSLSAPPSGILFVLALCSNLLRKHPEMACLIHRAGRAKGGGGDKTIEEGMQDGFDHTTNDPEQANALESSLWELGALERHYYPAVVTLAKSIGREEELETPLYNLEDDFIAHSYKSLFEQERNKRRRKGKTPLTFTKPTSLFREGDVFSDILVTSNDQETDNVTS